MNEAWIGIGVIFLGVIAITCLVFASMLGRRLWFRELCPSCRSNKKVVTQNLWRLDMDEWECERCNIRWETLPFKW